MAGMRWRSILMVLGVLALLAGSGVVVYRVLAPHETLTAPTVPYPEVALITDERPYSELRAAPLVVEGRLRVYAEKWRVWADAPVGVRYESTPYWAFRRWPAQVVGVVTGQTSTGPLVITQWSDGSLVALDARRGAIAWRGTGPIGERKYDGRRTGASIVYEPRSLLTARAADRIVLLVTGPRAAVAFDLATGQSLWRRELPAGCEPTGWTGAGLLVLSDCKTPSIHLINAVNGSELASFTSPDPAVPPSPSLCELGRTECRLVSVEYKTWLLGADGSVDSVPSLEVGAQLAGERVIYQTGTGVAARRLVDVTPLWTWNGRAKLVGADAAGVYLLTNDRTVLELSPATGHLVAIGCASSESNEDWQLGHVYPTGGTYLALERVTNASPRSDDQQYFYGPRPVALVELYTPTKLPVWPGKFAACRPTNPP
jgi:outer membrane protein assembly factor BamB